MKILSVVVKEARVLHGGVAPLEEIARIPMDNYCR